MVNLICTVIAGLLSTLIILRCLTVITETRPRIHQNYFKFLGFGISYILLALASLWVALTVFIDHYVHPAMWLFLLSSAGLIIFDRRAAKCWSVIDCPEEKVDDTNP